MRLLKRKSDGGIFPWTEALSKNINFDPVSQPEADRICAENAKRAHRQAPEPTREPVKPETLLDIEATVRQELKEIPAASEGSNVSVIGGAEEAPVVDMSETTALSNTELKRLSREKLAEHAFLRFGEKVPEELSKKEVAAKIAELEAAKE